MFRLSFLAVIRSFYFIIIIIIIIILLWNHLCSHWAFQTWINNYHFANIITLVINLCIHACLLEYFLAVPLILFLIQFLDHWCLVLLQSYSFLQNLLVAWINLRITLSKSLVLSALIAIKMVGMRVLWKTFFYSYIQYLETHFLINVAGECGPTERKVSPDKLYRAALLKNRFADTILKAREKTLTKVKDTYLSYMAPTLLIIIVLILVWNWYVILLNLIWLRSGWEGWSWEIAPAEGKARDRATERWFGCSTHVSQPMSAVKC